MKRYTITTTTTFRTLHAHAIRKAVSARRARSSFILPIDACRRAAVIEQIAAVATLRALRARAYYASRGDKRADAMSRDAVNADTRRRNAEKAVGGHQTISAGGVDLQHRLTAAARAYVARSIARRAAIIHGDAAYYAADVDADLADLLSAARVAIYERMPRGNGVVSFNWMDMHAVTVAVRRALYATANKASREQGLPVQYDRAGRDMTAAAAIRKATRKDVFDMIDILFKNNPRIASAVKAHMCGETIEEAALKNGTTKKALWIAMRRAAEKRDIAVDVLHDLLL